MRFLFLILAGLTLLSCGGKSRSSATEFKVIPDQPIIISADRKRGDITDAGPWFQYTLQVTNNDESSAITIAAIKVTITGVDATGAPATATVTHTAGDMDTAATDAQAECKYIYYKSIPAKTTSIVSVDNGSNDCKGDVFFIDTNGPGGQDLQSYHYRVKLELIGWFGDANNPEERFQTFYNFSAK